MAGLSFCWRHSWTLMAMHVERLAAVDTGKLVAASRLFDEPIDEVAAARYLSAPENALLVAYVGDEPAGFVRGTILHQLSTTRRQMFLYEIGVDDRFQRQGIGRALIQAMAGLARQEDCAEMFVFTNRSNSAAMRLYETTGGITEADDEQMFVYYLFDPPAGQESSVTSISGL
jgi:ribosomal protein S18 acetylase RimI-like enzyme